MEWLEVPNADEGDKEENEGGEKYSDECDIKEDTLLTLPEETCNWEKWNPKKLQTPLSTQLRASVTKRKSAIREDHSADCSGIEPKKKKNDFVQLVPNKPITKKPNTKVDKFSAFAKSKEELVKVTLKNANEKHQFELKILKMQLQKEALKLK